MNDAYESIKRGLKEAIDYSEGENVEIRTYHPEPVDVKMLRHRLGYTQIQFAAAFGISVATLRHWERGDRTPRGPALVLLNLVQRSPQSVLNVLNQ